MPPQSPDRVFTGTTQTLLDEQPSLTLDFYSYGMIMTKRAGEVTTTYAVDPKQFIDSLHTRVTFSTGLISTSCLGIRYGSNYEDVVEYRPPQLTGIWLDSITEPLRVPLPGLIMVRRTYNGARPDYHLYAVKRRPESTQDRLFNVPLSNVYDSHEICWGSVRKVSLEALQSTSLTEDWKALFGTSFGGHSAGRKSKSFPLDVRQKLIELDQKKAKRYPVTDLVPTKFTVDHLLGNK